MTTKVFDVSSSIIKVGSNDILYLSWEDPNVSQLTSLPFGSAYNLRLFRKGSQTGTNLNGLWTSNPVSPFNFMQIPLSSNGIWLNNTHTKNLILNAQQSPYYTAISSNGQYQIILPVDLEVPAVVNNNYAISSDFGISWIDLINGNNAGIPNSNIGNFIAINSQGDKIYFTTSFSNNKINKSTNYGQSFTEINYPESSSIASIACDPTGDNLVWAAGGKLGFGQPFVYPTTQAYFSNNGGSSWSTCSSLNSYLTEIIATTSVYWTSASISNSPNGGSYNTIFLTFTPASSITQSYLCYSSNFVFSSINDPYIIWVIKPISDLISNLGSSPKANFISLGLSNSGTNICFSFNGEYFYGPGILDISFYTCTSQFPFTSFNIINNQTSYNYYNYSFCISNDGKYQYAIKTNNNTVTGTSNIIYSSDFGQSWTSNYNSSNIWLVSVSCSDNAYYLNSFGANLAAFNLGLVLNSANGYNPGVDISYNPTIPGGNILNVYLDPSGNVWYNNPPSPLQLPIPNNIFIEGGYLGLIQRNYQISNFLSPSVAATFFNNLENPKLQYIHPTISYFLNTQPFGSVNPSIPGLYAQNMSYDWFVQYNNVTQPQLIVPDISYISQTTINAALPFPLPASGNIDLFCETTFDLSSSDPFYADPLLITYFIDPSVNTFYGLNTIELSSNVLQLIDMSFNDSSANQIFDFQAFFYGDDSNRAIGCRWVDPSYAELTNDITGSPYNLRLYKRQIGVEPSEIAQWFPSGEVVPFIYQNDISMGFPIQSNWLDVSLNSCPSCKVMAFFFDAAGNISYNSVFSSVSSPFTQANSGGYILVVQRNYKDSIGNTYYTTVGSYLSYISPPLKIAPLGPTTIIVNTAPPYRSTYYNNGELNMSYQWTLNNPSTGFTQNVGTNISYNFENDLTAYNGLGLSYYQCAVTFQFNYPPYDNNGTPFFEITPVTIIYGNGDLTSLSVQYDIDLCFKPTSFPPPPWARFSLVCGTDGDEFTPEQLQMRRKAEVLQYYNNKVNMQKSTKAQQWSFVARGLSSLQNTYATQTVNFTNPNTTNFPNTNRAIVLSGNCINPALRVSTFPSYCSDVPGRVVPLTFDPRVPLVRFKRIYTYPTVNQPATSDQVNSG